ncbi:MAG: cell division protein ZipA [Gammaproteobacteria bacterium]|nr:cell division protein ZipA [Gammaproteobacteria bacterium]
MFANKGAYFSFLVILVVSAAFLFRKKKSLCAKAQTKQEPTVGDTATIVEPNPSSPEVKITDEVFDPNTIIMQIRANPGRPYMGYELLQVILETGFRFGKMNLFHRHQNANGEGPVLFSLASATKEGTFELNSMGGVSCPGVILFMHLDNKKKLMQVFDLMLDVARQFIEDLGGEILDEKQRPLDATVINNWRQKIAIADGNKYYKANLFDNL